MSTLRFQLAKFLAAHQRDPNNINEQGHYEPEPFFLADEIVDEFELEKVKLKLSDYALEKIDFICKDVCYTQFPEIKPNLEWTGAVLDLIEELKKQGFI